jgi:hypothetical protein
MLKKKEAMMVQAWRRRGELALLSLPLHNYNKTMKNASAEIFYLKLMDVKVIVSINA